MKKIFLTIILIAISMTACHDSKEVVINEGSLNSGKVKVETLELKKQGGENELSYSGVVEPSVTTSLSFRLPGSVSAIYVDEGRPVGKGQILAVLDNGAYQSSYDAALASQKQALDALERMRTVYEKGSLPEIQWEEIKAKVEQAKSMANISKKNLDDCLLRAPSRGVIGSRKIEIGSNVVPGVPVFELVNISTVYVKISVPENEISRIKKGDKARVVIPAISQDAYSGEVETIGVLASPVSKTYDVKIMLRNKNLAIKPGMACDISLDLLDNSSKLLAPFKSIIKDKNDSSFVYIVDPNEKIAKKQIVKMGKILNEGVEIVSGLIEGDLIIVNGWQKIEDNTPVIY